MSLEFNKAAASVLVALIVFMVTGFLAQSLVSPNLLEKAAYPIKGGTVAAAPSGETPAAPAKAAPLSAEMLAKADPAAGEAIAHKCMVCHTFGKGEAAKVGPNLYGIIGAKRAHMAGFNYSDAMQKLGGIWTVQEIQAFIAAPQDYLPGTRMGFAGLPKPQDRADVLAFLNKDSDAPVDLVKAGTAK